MKNAIARLKPWIQNKYKALNASLVDQIEERIKFYYRAEYLCNCALNCIEPGISNEKYCDNEIIVSLTTYGKRLNQVYLAIESILQQLLKPNRIILWLEEGLKKETLPIVLQKQQKRGLEIKYCKDILSYKKLIPALTVYPNATIITIDDDSLYNIDLVENFIITHIKNPNIILCGRMHRMKLDSFNSLTKYKKWIKDYNEHDASSFNFPTGVGGILYPPNCFNNEVFNESVFMNICKYADDVWFKAMALLNGGLAQKINTSGKNSYLENNTVQDISLYQINVKNNLNDVQLKAVFDKYKLYDKLIASKNKNS